MERITHMSPSQFNVRNPKWESVEWHFESKLKNYVIEEQVGIGSFGIVYRAY